MSKIYDEMTRGFVDRLAEQSFELCSISRERKEKADGSIETFCRLEVEIKRSKLNKALSKERFTVKVLTDELVVNPEVLEDYEVYVVFDGLEISFISSNRQVYFRAKGVRLVQDQEVQI